MARKSKGGKNYSVPPEKWCRGVKKDGTMCMAPKVNGQERCQQHGGQAEFAGSLKQKPSGEYRQVKSYADVVDVLEYSINAIQTGELDSHQGRAVSSLAMAAIKAIEMRDKTNKPQDLNGREALDLLARGIGVGMAREVLLSRNFAMLKNPSDIFEIETPQMKAEKLILEMESKDNASETLDGKEIFGSEPEPLRAIERSDTGGDEVSGEIF